MTLVAFPSFTALAQRLTAILGGLRAAAAARGGVDRAAVPLLTLVWTRFGWMAKRFEALVTRLVAGRYGSGRVSGPRTRRTTQIKAGAVRLPGGRDWLIRLLPQEAVAYRGHLEALLAEPEMAALLAAAPGAGRILRPLCRMLELDPGPAACGGPGGWKPAPLRVVKRVEDAPTEISLVWAAIEAAASAIRPDNFVRRPAWRHFVWSG